MSICKPALIRMLLLGTSVELTFHVLMVGYCVLNFAFSVRSTKTLDALDLVVAVIGVLLSLIVSGSRFAHDCYLT